MDSVSNGHWLQNLLNNWNKQQGFGQLPVQGSQGTSATSAGQDVPDVPQGDTISLSKEAQARLAASQVSSEPIMNHSPRYELLSNAGKALVEQGSYLGEMLLQHGEEMMDGERPNWKSMREYTERLRMERLPEHMRHSSYADSSSTSKRTSPPPYPTPDHPHPNETDPRWIATDYKINPHKGTGGQSVIENGRGVIRPYVFSEEEMKAQGNGFVRSMETDMYVVSGAIKNNDAGAGERLLRVKIIMDHFDVHEEYSTYFAENSTRHFGRPVTLESLFEKYALSPEKTLSGADHHA